MTITLRMPDGVPLTAQQERQAWAAVHGGGSGRQLGGRSGFRVGTPSTVLTATSTTWTLGPCAAMIDPLASTYQGMYGWSSDANITGAVTAADATYARKDVVYIRVNDSSAGDGSGALNANVYYLAGNPTADPQVPTVPQRGFLVGVITVPQAGGGSPTVALNPARYVAAGAPLPVPDKAARDALTVYPGLQVMRMDLGGAIETYSGVRWNRIGGVVQFTSSSNPLNATPYGAGTFFPDSDAATGQNVDPGMVVPDAPDFFKAADVGTFSVHCIVTLGATQTVTGLSKLSIVKGGVELALGYGVNTATSWSVSLPGISLAKDETVAIKAYHLNGVQQDWTFKTRIVRVG